MVSVRSLAVMLLALKAIRQGIQTSQAAEDCLTLANNTAKSRDSLYEKGWTIASSDACQEAVKGAVVTGGIAMATLNTAQREGIMLFIGLMLAVAAMKKDSVNASTIFDGFTALVSVLSSTARTNKIDLNAPRLKGRFVSTKK